MKNRNVHLLPMSLLFCSTSLFSQERITLSLDDYRPLAKTAELLERKLGVPVNYEDPLYAYSGDLSDVTDKANAEFRTASPARRLMAPRPSKLTMDVSINTEKSTGRVANPIMVIQNAIAAYSTGGGAGEFSVIEDSGSLYIAPQRIKNGKGNMESRTAVMDTVVLLQPTGTTSMEAIETLCSNLTGLVGHQVAIATVPTNMLINRTVDRSQKLQGSVRTILEKILNPIAQQATDKEAASYPKLAWSLLYDPGMNTHFLNIRVVMVEVPLPFGGKWLQPLLATH